MVVNELYQARLLSLSLCSGIFGALIWRWSAGLAVVFTLRLRSVVRVTGHPKFRVRSAPAPFRATLRGHTHSIFAKHTC